MVSSQMGTRTRHQCGDGRLKQHIGGAVAEGVLELSDRVMVDSRRP